MFMPATDYNQQLLAYLQMLRQLLDQVMAMATAGAAFPAPPFAMPPAPFMAPGGQFMPATMPTMPPAPPSTAPAPPTPPAPGDYAQQLFGYLQAWRQYLEQVAATGPGSGPLGGGGKPANPPNGTSAPGNGAGGGDTSRSEAGGGSGPTPPPKLLDLPPTNLGGSQLTADDFGGTNPLAPSGQTGPLIALAPTGYPASQISGPGLDLGGSMQQGPNEPQMLTPPGNDLGTFMPPPPPFLLGTPVATNVLRPGPLVEQSPGSSFQSAIDRLDPAAVQEVVPKSLFSTPEA
jgi:hypothetical protein